MEPSPRPERLRLAIAAIDRINASDPNLIIVTGVEQPKEPIHARMVTDWVVRLDPDASEEQLIAARAHHLRRWSIARSDYPEGRAGYLRWRTALKRQHAEEVARLIGPLGYGSAEIVRVQNIMQKVGLPTDRAAQTHEDALCLVFLTTQLDGLTADLGEDRTVEVLVRTLGKMSAGGHAAALELELSEDSARLLQRAVAIAAEG